MANLTQLRQLEELDGFLLVDKPVGIAFASVVKAVKRKFNLVKVGHGGSLDAQSSGLLILLLGDANKFVERVMGADREYEGTLDFSYVTNTGDAQGVKVERGAALPIEELRGDVFQTEPNYAAIRKEATAEYEVVDTGAHAQFMGHVYKFEILAEGRFFLRATKNILPRALALDLGATLTSLRRMKVGKFSVEQAVGFDKVLTTETKDFADLVMPLKEALA